MNGFNQCVLGHEWFLSVYLVMNGFFQCTGSWMVSITVLGHEWFLSVYWVMNGFYQCTGSCMVSISVYWVLHGFYQCVLSHEWFLSVCTGSWMVSISVYWVMNGFYQCELGHEWFLSVCTGSWMVSDPYWQIPSWWGPSSSNKFSFIGNICAAGWKITGLLKGLSGIM